MSYSILAVNLSLGVQLIVQARYHDPNLWLFCGIRKKSKAHDATFTPAHYTKEAALGADTFDVSDPSFQDSSGSSFISRWVAKYYAPLFESNLFKIVVVSRASQSNFHLQLCGDRIQAHHRGGTGHCVRRVASVNDLLGFRESGARIEALRCYSNR